MTAVGVEQFSADSPIYQSAHSLSFISPANRPKNSHCEALGLRTPSFTPEPVPHGAHLLFYPGIPSGVTLLHTPGHTPDEIALWDDVDKMLYVGDTLYEFEPIIFPNEGSIVEWLSSVDMLVEYVLGTSSPQSAMINCGHRTTMRPALDVLRTTKDFMLDVVAGKEEIRRRERRGDVEYVEYLQHGGRYRLICPERLVLEARDQIES